MGKQGELARRRWTAEEATRVLTAWRQSELSVRAFSRQNGFTAQRVYWWKKRLESWSGEPVRLVPVVTPSAIGVEPRVCVRLGADLVIEVSGAVSPEWLSALARGLR